MGRRPSNPKCKRGSTRVIVMRSHRPCTVATLLTGRVTRLLRLSLADDYEMQLHQRPGLTVLGPDGTAGCALAG